MRIYYLKNLIALVVACSCLVAFANQSNAQDAKGNTAQPEKARLVLMPLRVSDDNKSMRSAMENALVEGLQRKYVVFEGEQVAKKANEIFLKETRQKNSDECNEIRCLQNIAEAFQAELIASANVTKIDGGYLLSLNIQNIFDNVAVFSNTVSCRDCDGFQIVDKLKLLDNETANLTTQSATNSNIPQSNNGANVSEDALWNDAQKANRIANYKDYLAQYPGGRYASIAEDRISYLQEQAARGLSQQDQNAWNNATLIATEASYQDYLNRFPKGLFIVQAKARIKKSQDARQKSVAETKPGGVFRDCPDCPEMVIVPAGEFNMGSNNAGKDEQPVHHVTIAKIFAMGKTEVTQGQWRALMSTTREERDRESGLGELVGKLEHILPEHRRDVTESHFDAILQTSPEYLKNCDDNCTPEQRRAIRDSQDNDNSATHTNRIIVDNNPSYFKSCGDECPVEHVSWTDAQKYIQNLSAKTGKHYRLPTEAEWEYACRGGSQNEYCGSDQVTSVAWYGANTNPPGNSSNSTNPVATLSANGFGLYDMSGNVWEWVEDNYHENYSGAPVDGSVWLGDSVWHTLRGGGWNSSLKEVRAAHRSKIIPFGRGNVGFRVVRVLP